MGLLTEFVLTEGTGGVCYPWEPGGGNGNIVSGGNFSPAYSVGYNLLDAIYMDMDNILFQNVLVGDPLTRIYPDDYQRITISGDTTITSGEIWGRIVIPSGETLTISSGSTFAFRKNSYLIVYGNLQLNSGSTINFNGSSSLNLSGGLIINGNQINMNFNDCSKFNLNENVTMNTSSNYLITLNDGSKFQVDGTLNVDENSISYFNNDSELLVNGTTNINENGTLYFNDETNFGINGTLNINENSILNFSGSSQLYVATLANIFPGAILNFNEDSHIIATGDFICQGSASNNIIFNFTNSTVEQFFYRGKNTLIIDYSVFNNGEVVIERNPHLPGAELLNITNSTFLGCQKAIVLKLSGVVPTNPAYIAYCSFWDITEVGIEIQQVSEIEIEHCTIILESSENSVGIRIRNAGDVFISDVLISDGGIGITSYLGDDDDPEIIEDLLTNIEINQCVIETDVGISLNGQHFPINMIDIYGNHFETEGDGIVINDFSTNTLNISENIMVGYSGGGAGLGISLMNGNEGLVSNNSISNYQIGIYLGTITNPLIVDNSTSAVDLTAQPGPGIFMESSNGKIRNNSISGHSNGIELGNASPDIGGNTITDNLYHGIYVGSGSLPNMIGELAGSPPLYYPIAGYNDIFDNGGWDDPHGPNDNDGSEIFISNANVLMRRGCNSIVDDRIPGGDLINTQLLMNSAGDGLPIEVRVEYNFWGNHPIYPLSTRFGSLIAYYDPSYSEPCSLPQGASGGGSELLMTASNGEIVDTVYSVDRELGDLSTTELLYAVAEEKFLTADYENAENVYNQIINSNDTLFAKLKAYQRLYNLGRLTNKGPAYFSDLKTVYSSLSQLATDSLLGKIFTQLSSLSLVGQTEYVSAIEEFDAVVQQNQGTEEAMYAEIDALTTALLLAPDSSLGKGRLGKYAVTDISDYTNRVSNLLKQRVGSSNYNKEPIPTEYALYQNYPNPFNPSTTIKYSIVKAGKVTSVQNKIKKKVPSLQN